MKILFHSNQLGLRGTEVSLYDYAEYNESILGNESIIVSDITADLSAYQKFKNRFEVYLYTDFHEEVNKLVDKKGIDVCYFQKSGQSDGKLINGSRSVVHSVFQFYQPHGDIYAYISKWLANKMGGPNQEYVPYIVDILRYDHHHNYRDFLSIPKDATVFGYYGGPDSFNIEFVKKAVIDVAKKNSNIYFLFMNSNEFGDKLENVIFLQGTTEFDKKIGFINTCDACIHARNGGESFGLTIAEFSVKNKPVITTDYCTVSLNDLAHIEMLGDKALFYRDYSSIYDTIINFRDIVKKKEDWNAYSSYTPQNVMNKFKSVFLD